MLRPRGERGGREDCERALIRHTLDQGGGGLGLAGGGWINKAMKNGQWVEQGVGQVVG